MHSDVESCGTSSATIAPRSIPSRYVYTPVNDDLRWSQCQRQAFGPLLKYKTEHLTLFFTLSRQGLTHTHTHARTHGRTRTHTHTYLHTHRCLSPHKESPCMSYQQSILYGESELIGLPVTSIRHPSWQSRAYRIYWHTGILQWRHRIRRCDSLVPPPWLLPK